MAVIKSLGLRLTIVPEQNPLVAEGILPAVSRASCPAEKTEQSNQTVEYTRIVG